MSDEPAAIAELRAQGYFPMRVQARTPPKAAGTRASGLILFPVKPRDRALFFRHLAATLKAGINPAKALHSCEASTPNVRLRRMIRECIPRVEAGNPLSEVLRNHPQICPAVTVEILQAGEKGGFLDSSLNMIAEDLEMEVEVRQQLKWQTLHFKIVFPIALMIPAIPRIISLERLPLSGYLMRYLTGLRETTLPVILLLCSGWLLLRLGQLVPSVRATMDNLKMCLPGFSTFARNRCRSRFTTNLAYLIKAGIPVPGALRTAAPTCGNESMERALLTAVPALEQGERLAEVLGRTRQLSPHDLQIIATGEESGTLSEALDRLSRHYQNEVKGGMKNLANVLRIPMYLALGAVVAYAVGGAAKAYFNRVFELGDEMMNF
ncbi:MAG: type II secretion system F family protein [Armatimonadetes bacterium]|nr:type II secretion system F family protein [Armatimonadota bacterium]